MSWLSPDPRQPNGKWRNRKSGKIRDGWWGYYRPSDVFFVKIKGLQMKRVHDDSPEYGNWELVREGGK